MPGFMITLLICSITMSALALLYMALTPFLAKRYSEKVRYYSWLFIVIGLIIPFRPQLSDSIIKVNVPINAAVPNIQIGDRAPITVYAGNVIPSTLHNISWWQITAAVWIAGIIIFLVYHAVKHYRFLKLAARWSENITDEQTLMLLQTLKCQIGLSQNIGLQTCDSIGSPMMIGFVNPCILLPSANFTLDELFFILKHELIHYKRKDLWYKSLVMIATAIHWFNPIVYFMARAIDVQCELSCDEEVVRNTDANIRQFYSETIIGVIRYQSKLKTALSTNFYGGKKGMKKRIFSIMDTRKKKAGVAVLCGVLMFTLGTGFAFTAKMETQSLPESIKEDIMVSSKFLPDPAIYTKYSPYGITISSDGKMLQYNGQRVRLFVDEHSEVEAFFLDEAGELDLAVNRNEADIITGIESISDVKAQQYCADFFANDLNPTDTSEAIPQDFAVDVATDIVGQNKYEQYSAYGIILSADGKVLNYDGQRVKLFADMLSDGSFEVYWFDEAGTVNLSVVRSASDQITAIESITEKQAEEYRSALDIYEQNALIGLDDKVSEKVNNQFPEN